MINKKGVSGVVTVVILVALSVALVAIVWSVVQNMVESNLEQAESCSSLFTEKVVGLNNEYTCDDGSSIYFSVGVGDVEIDAVLIKIEGKTASKTYKLNEVSSSPNLKLYTGQDAHAPGKNSDLTYNLSVAGEGLSPPYSIGVSPIINGNTCDEIDRINVIGSCGFIQGFP
ncbi:hypothetical protein KAR91_58375 [Candidatus Pacearchaeota archaeon]|nr:hypothetical protein [Candidatus Pacearchaeota archaeon]